MDFESFFRGLKLNIEDIGVDPDCGTWLDQGHSFDLEPKMFLKFAKDDLASGGIKGYVNALTNAKRAVDSQTDKFLECMSYNISEDLPVVVKVFIDKFESSNGTADTTVRLKLLRALNITPTTIISSMRTLRNKLEHNYSLPSKEDVINAIELAQLFISATDNSLHSFFESYSLGNKTTNVYIQYNMDEKTFHCIGRLNTNRNEVNIANDDKFFLYLMRISFSIGTFTDVESSVKEMFAELMPQVPFSQFKVKFNT